MTSSSGWGGDKALSRLKTPRKVRVKGCRFIGLRGGQGEVEEEEGEAAIRADGRPYIDYSLVLDGQEHRDAYRLLLSVPVLITAMPATPSSKPPPCSA